MFYRKIVTYVLLALYGVGPHWHNHHGCVDDGITCSADFCSTVDRTSQCAAYRPQASTAKPCCVRDHARLLCNHDQPRCNASHCIAVSLPSTSRGNLELCSKGQQTDCGSCAICHFYSCMPFVTNALSIQPLDALVESLLVTQSGQPRTNYRLHLARGPPADRVFA